MRVLVSSFIGYVAIFALLFPQYSYSNNSPLKSEYVYSENAELLDLKRDMQKVKTLAKQIKAGIQANVNDFYYSCLKAFGHKTACMCLAKERPMGIDFIGYIIIITEDKQELLKKTKSTEERKLVDLIYDVRDKCLK